MTGFDLPGALRRIRRMSDMSQREVARAVGISAAAVGRAESGSRDLPVGLLARVAALAELRLALVDDAGREVAPMRPGAVRDAANRLFPAHLDTVLSEERAWRWDHRPHRRRPTYTFDRRRPGEDRRTAGRPDDHLVPEPGDSPEDRRRARQRAARERAEEEIRRRREAGTFCPVADFVCGCPSRCDELDDWSGRPVHADDCPCSCDLA